MNRLKWQMGLDQGIQDLYMFDNTVFDLFAVDSSIDRQLCLDAIMLKYGGTPLFRPDPAFMKYYIGVWSKKNAESWRRLHATMTVVYDPIENYNRYENGTDGRTAAAESTDKMTGTTGEKVNQSTDAESTSGTKTNDTSSQNTINTISADNSDSYQPDTQTNGTSTATNVSNNSADSSEKISRSSDSTASEDRTHAGTEKEQSTHDLHVHGNIGVTTSQQMLESERELVKFNIYDYIADSFHSEFCLYVY